MARVVHFEITADDPETSSPFSTRSSGMEDPSHGRRIALLARDHGRGRADGDRRGDHGSIRSRSASHQHDRVGDLEATMEAVRNAGGKADGDIDDIPTVGRFTYATDTEGNRFGILEPLPRG